MSALRDDSGDLIALVTRAVSRLDDPRGALVVLDDFPDVDVDSAHHLALLGRQIGLLGARVVVTARELRLEAAPLLHDAQVLDADDLRLSTAEAAAVATAIAGHAVEEPEVATLREVCGGHPATFAVLFRHSSLGPDGWVPKSSALLI